MLNYEQKTYRSMHTRDNIFGVPQIWLLYGMMVSVLTLPIAKNIILTVAVAIFMVIVFRKLFKSDEYFLEIYASYLLEQADEYV